MRRLWARSLFLAVIGLGCTVGPRLVPVTESTGRFVRQGFSVLPPRGENWLILEEGAGQIVFGKQFRETAGRGDSVIAAADTIKVKVPFKDPTEFLRFVEQSMIEGLLPRLRLPQARVSLDSFLGATCAKYEGTVEDTGVPQFPGSVFITTMHGFSCLHPDSPGLLVRISYSKRFLQGLQPPSVEAEVEPFLKSLVFIPIK